MIGATPNSGGQMTTETEQAFSELLEDVAATHARMVEQLADDRRRCSRLTSGCSRSSRWPPR